jgi:hypothetical protein
MVGVLGEDVAGEPDGAKLGRATLPAAAVPDASELHVCVSAMPTRLRRQGGNEVATGSRTNELTLGLTVINKVPSFWRIMKRGVEVA